MNKKVIGMIIIIIVVIIAGLSVVNIKTEKQKETETYVGNVDLTYLDDTEISENVYAVNICGPNDCGIILLNNTGEKTDSFRFNADAPDGFDISFEHDIMQVNTEGIEWNTIYYETSLPTGSYFANITATSVNNPDAKDTITLMLDVTKTDGVATKKGDQVIVQYILWDTDGNQLDSGTLPATAGEPEAGPLEQITYIDGFYLGLLGMEKGFPQGETKKIRVPPELAYGTDPNDELGGETLIFQLIIMASAGNG